MTAPSDPEASPEPLDEEPEVLLRLGDILPRVPAHLLKPGPHDKMSQVRFSVDELAEKISRGRVSVPLERLASACPEVFRDADAFPGEQEIQLPLQKLLEQVGLVAPKTPASNGMPADQLAQARAEASRIIGAATGAPPAPAEPEAAIPSEPPVSPASEAAPPAPPRIGKALSAARQLLGIFSRSGEPKAQPAPEEKPREEKPPVVEEPSAISKAPEIAPVPPPEPAPAGCISLRALPIFRLLPAEILRSGALPSDDVRVIIPLEKIDSQLAGGHVEIPIEDFTKALPEGLRHTINQVPDTQVWIPLDEIFQSLPPDHLFYMPPLDPLAEPAPAAAEEIPPVEAIPGEKKTAVEEPEPPKPVSLLHQTPSEPSPEPTPAPPLKPPAHEDPPPVIAAPPPAPPEPTPPAPEAVSAVAPEPPTAAAPPAEPEREPVAAPALSTPEPTAAIPPQPAPEPAPAPEAPPLSRAPWMRGFQVPPPRLFAGGATPSQAPPEPAPAEPIPPAAPTPEARRTADFLASQPGIFAAAAFVQGAVFASADFPRKPDLDALRDFMGAFVDHARESGRRLGWTRMVTLACDQFHATAVVRETHFIVALHHDRLLPTLAHDALITAADDLSRAGS